VLGLDVHHSLNRSPPRAPRARAEDPKGADETDPAYPKGMHIWTGFKNADADWKHYVNNALSSERVAVEWGFGMITRRWRLLSDANRQKILETGLQHQYYVATFLTNLITCVEGGNQTSSHFGCHPQHLLVRRARPAEGAPGRAGAPRGVGGAPEGPGPGAPLPWGAGARGGAPRGGGGGRGSIPQERAQV